MQAVTSHYWTPGGEPMSFVNFFETMDRSDRPPGCVVSVNVGEDHTQVSSAWNTNSGEAGLDSAGQWALVCWLAGAALPDRSPSLLSV